MAIELVALAALLAGGGLLGYFIRMEREGRRHIPIQILLVVLLFEIVFQPDGIQARTGIFRIPVGAFDARPADLVVPVALAARALTSTVPRRVSSTALLWLCFITWYSVGGPVGYLFGESVTSVIAQLRGPLIGVCLMALVAGIDVKDLIGNQRLPRIGRVVGVLGAVLLVTHFSGMSVSSTNPVVGFKNLGALGADARTMFPILGVMAIIGEVAGGRRRVSVVLPSMALVASPIAATQGGPYLSLLVLLLTLTLVALGPTWRRRLNLTAADVGFVFSLFLIIGAVSIFSTGGESPAFVDQFEEAVLSDSQSTTTNERYQLWSEAVEIITDSPVWGDGLGVRGTIERPFPVEAVSTTFHNVLFDIAARTGLVGLGFFLVALASTALRAAVVWREHEDDTVAAFAMTSMLGVFCILGRALVSSSFEHTRVTVGLFLLIGLVLACDRSLSIQKENEAARLLTGAHH